jgi:hypothetical protein
MNDEFKFPNDSLGDKFCRLALYATASMLIAIFLMVIGCGWTSSGIAGLMFFVGASYSLEHLFLRRLDDDLRGLDDEASKKQTWEIRRSDATVAGYLTSRHWVNLNRDVFLEGRTAIAQACNLWWVAWRIAGDIMLFIPVIFFWCAVWLALFEPEMLMAVREIQQADPSSLVAALQITAGVVLFAFSMLFFLGFRFGFKNHYHIRFQQLLRSDLNIVADGDLSIVSSIPRCNPENA